MIELEFVVWEFVRLMVELEDSNASKQDDGAFAAWRLPWQEIDDRLTDLGKSDMNGFSDLMMDQTITVPCGAPAHLSKAIEALERVAGKLKAEIAQTRDNDQREDELKFELAELTGLIERLRAIDPKVLASG